MEKYETIKWYKVKCSLYKEEFGVRKWIDLVNFISKTVGFDYTIEGQTTKPYTGVEAYLDSKGIHRTEDLSNTTQENN